jgi:hypothetical protein
MNSQYECIFSSYDCFVLCTFLVFLLERSLVYCHTCLSIFASFIAIHTSPLHSSRPGS